MEDRLVFSMSFWSHASTMLSSLHLLPRYLHLPSCHPHWLIFPPSIAHLFHSLRRRCLPLGLCNSRPPLWPHPWILHRLAQFLRLGVRSCLCRVHPIKRGGTDVCRIPPRLGHRAVARLCRFHHHNMVLLRAGHFREPGIAILEPDRIDSCCWRWHRDHHRGRSDAEGACSQLGRVG